MKFAVVPALFCLIVSTSANVAAQNVIEDAGVGMSKSELEALVGHWTPDMQKAAANDVSDRFELLSMALSGKRIALEADKITEESDAETYWRKEFMLRNHLRDFVLKEFVTNLDIPDMSDLAEERYKTQKDKIGLVPESRYSSHILIKCLPGVCDRDTSRVIAEEVEAKLAAGESFEELVEQYSGDQGSKKRKGKFDRWVTIGEAHVVPEYRGALFDIEKVGGYSPITESRFGFHIIRLDEIKEAHYKPYEEVAEQMKASLEQEYMKLAAAEFDKKFRLSEKAYIDGAAMEEIFEPYKTEDTVEE